MSTGGQVGCPAVEKLASLQQAPGRLHVETWAGRNGNPILPISQVLEITPRCAETVVRLPSPSLSSVSPGSGREIRNWLGWTPLEKTARSGVWRFRGALVGSSIFSHLLQRVIGFSEDRFLQLEQSPSTFFVFLLICVWPKHGCRATIWKAVLDTTG